ncbi:hypothetical protein EDL99_07435 [Ornithobacterium rhinotracheale]|uniref:hypothetical protein n=1 Tax=Ornithobacterium rhinotracheale TaxID=28251 RepID=UPI00129CB4E6|nr:hypothetical protein [Ornithobacterium rhinotracheale]MRJ08699.1 hypothetical protein [Ornithobacterium rhinotracheale]UOH76855.1 hypothetical protein MT996_06400 [Ornithobacterium rhinotracheale]
MKKILYIAVALFSANAMAQRVGVNTETPQAALEVNGNVSLEAVPMAGLQEQTYNLLIDKNTRRLVIASGDKKVFNNVSYRITTNSNQDWIYDANTNVPTNQYTAILVSSFFGNAYYDENEKKGVRYGIKHANNGYGGNIAETVSVEPGDDGNWHIKADYEGADPFIGGLKGDWDAGKYAREGKDSFYWKFNILYVDSGSLIDLGEAEGSVDKDRQVGQWDQGTGYSNPIEYLKAKK